MREADFKTKFQNKVKRELKPVAILQYKQDATTVKGFPDALFIFEGIVVFIEFKKSKTARFQEGQKLWLDRLNDNCHFAFVCYPQNADEIFNELKRLVK